VKKRVLITGGNKGLGKAIALNMATKSDIETIVITARNNTQLEETKKEILKINFKIDVKAIQGDLSSFESITDLINELKKSDISFNVIINNAGTGDIGPFEDTEDRKIEEVFYVNAIAPTLLIKNLLPGLRQNGWGRIINISSISVFKPNALLLPYVVSKSVLKSLSECITAAEIKNGITCNTIMPGLMLTDLGKKSIKRSFPDYNDQNAAEIENKVAKNMPSGQLVDLSEITSTIDFLLSDSARGISGEYFRVASGII